MIDDIVALPRRLERFKRGGLMSSINPIFIPESRLDALTGYRSYNDDSVVGLGNEFEIIAGNSCPYRYKFIENARNSILEYFAISDEPIVSKNASIFTLWCSEVDKETLRVNKKYNWLNICRASECLHNLRSRMLSQIVQDNLRLMTTLHGAPNLVKMYGWAHNTPLAISAELSEIDRMLVLNENLKSYENAWEYEYLEPVDVFRGIPTLSEDDSQKNKGCSWSSKVLCGSVVKPSDVKKLLSSRGPTKPFHMCVRSINDPVDGTDITGESNNSANWFDVLKYIELIPYGEFFIGMSFPDKGIDSFTVYNSYDPGTKKEYGLNQIDPYVKGIISKIMECFDLDRFEPAKLYIYKSWAEEVYITLQNSDNKRATTRLYFDLAYAAIGSRMFYSDEYL